MCLGAAHARALQYGKSLIINGVIHGSASDPVIVRFVSQNALERCLVSGETDEAIAVVLYEDEEEW